MKSTFRLLVFFLTLALISSCGKPVDEISEPKILQGQTNYLERSSIGFQISLTPGEFPQQMCSGFRYERTFLITTASCIAEKLNAMLADYRRRNLSTPNIISFDSHDSFLDWQLFGEHPIYIRMMDTQGTKYAGRVYISVHNSFRSSCMKDLSCADIAVLSLSVDITNDKTFQRNTSPAKIDFSNPGFPKINDRVYLTGIGCYEELSPYSGHCNITDTGFQETLNQRPFMFTTVKERSSAVQQAVRPSGKPLYFAVDGIALDGSLNQAAIASGDSGGPLFTIEGKHGSENLSDQNDDSSQWDFGGIELNSFDIRVHGIAVHIPDRSYNLYNQYDNLILDLGHPDVSSWLALKTSHDMGYVPIDLDPKASHQNCVESFNVLKTNKVDSSFNLDRWTFRQLAKGMVANTPFSNNNEFFDSIDRIRNQYLAANYLQCVNEIFKTVENSTCIKNRSLDSCRADADLYNGLYEMTEFYSLRMLETILTWQDIADEEEAVKQRIDLLIQVYGYDYEYTLQFLEIISMMPIAGDMADLIQILQGKSWDLEPHSTGEMIVMGSLLFAPAAIDLGKPVLKLLNRSVSLQSASLKESARLAKGINRYSTQNLSSLRKNLDKVATQLIRGPDEFSNLVQVSQKFGYRNPRKMSQAFRLSKMIDDGCDLSHRFTLHRSPYLWEFINRAWNILTPTAYAANKGLIDCFLEAIEAYAELSMNVSGLSIDHAVSVTTRVRQFCPSCDVIDLMKNMSHGRRLAASHVDELLDTAIYFTILPNKTVDIVKLAKIQRSPLTPNSIILDSQLAIFQNNYLNGVPIVQNNHKLWAQHFKTIDISDLRITDLSAGVEINGLSQLQHGIRMTTTRDSPAYKATLAQLQQLNVGQGKGAADRIIVADSFFAEGAMPKFMTADKHIYNKLYRSIGGDPSKIDLLKRYSKSGFQVPDPGGSGRSITVFPVRND
ncbi:MAG: trypsin-like serine protease [Oligoflexus sp.]